MRRVACAACAALAFAPALSGCGERDEPEPAATPVETSDPVPELPRKWSRHVNSRAGFAVGLPPGWSARDRRAGLATYTAVVATNAKRAAGRHRDEIRRILRSVRGRPVKRPGR
jgi:hypothetical protein